MAMDHTNCAHARTPAGRKACRNGTHQAVVVAPIEKEIYRARLNQTARARAGRDTAARPTCVQAALHIDAHGGRCACGWIAAKIS